MEGTARRIDINTKKLERKAGKSHQACGWIQKTEWKGRVQEERVLQQTTAQISKLDRTQTKYPALRITTNENIQNHRFIET